MELGVEELNAGDLSAARQSFIAASAADAQNVDAILHLGQIDAIEGRDRDAIAKFVAVVRRTNGKHVPALFEAGCAYQATQQYDQAVLAFKHVLDNDPTHVQAAVHMGAVHETKGMVPEALGYYIQAAKIAAEAHQPGTARQLLLMVLARDSGHQSARYLLEEIEDQQSVQPAAQHTPGLRALVPDPAPSPPLDADEKVDADDEEDAAERAGYLSRFPAPADTGRLESTIIKAQMELVSLETQRDALQVEIDAQVSKLQHIQAERHAAEDAIRRARSGSPNGAV